MRLQGGRKRPLCGLVRGTAPCRFAPGADPGQPARNCRQHEARRRLTPRRRAARVRSGKREAYGGRAVWRALWRLARTRAMPRRRADPPGRQDRLPAVELPVRSGTPGRLSTVDRSPRRRTRGHQTAPPGPRSFVQRGAPPGPGGRGPVGTSLRHREASNQQQQSQDHDVGRNLGDDLATRASARLVRPTPTIALTRPSS